MQKRMLLEGPLHSREGKLNEAGYATRQIKRYERARLKAGKLRIKEWDYYLILSDQLAFALTVSDNGYLGLDSISLIDLDKKTQHTATRLCPFPMGKRSMPESSQKGVVRAVGKNYDITFRAGDGRRQLYGHMYDFKGPGVPLLFDIELKDPAQDSMVLALPFEKKQNQFYYNQKALCLPAEGRIILDGQDYLFSPASSFGMLDWGRGVWPHRVSWYWGAASGLVNGRAFGLNLGYGFGDRSQAGENMLFYQGTAHKLGEVRIKREKQGEQMDDQSTYHISEEAGRLSLSFEPILDRSARMNYALLMTDQHQVFGRFTGKAVLDDGSVLSIQQLTGFVEKVKNRW